VNENRVMSSSRSTMEVQGHSFSADSRENGKLMNHYENYESGKSHRGGTFVSYIIKQYCISYSVYVVMRDSS
jgi:hypothetical protein